MAQTDRSGHPETKELAAQACAAYPTKTYFTNNRQTRVVAAGGDPHGRVRAPSGADTRRHASPTNQHQEGTFPWRLLGREGGAPRGVVPSQSPSESHGTRETRAKRQWSLGQEGAPWSQPPVCRAVRNSCVVCVPGSGRGQAACVDQDRSRGDVGEEAGRTPTGVGEDRTERAVRTAR